MALFKEWKREFKSTVNGRQIKFVLVYREHADQRQLERARKCSFDQMGGTIVLALHEVVRVATSNKKNREDRILLVRNLAMDHSIAMNVRWAGTTCTMTVRTVMDTGSPVISRWHLERSEVVIVG